MQEVYRWSVRWSSLHGDFKDKTTSPEFLAGSSAPFVLDVYANGANEKARDSVGVYARYVGRSRRLLVEVRLSIPELGCAWTSEATVLGARVTETVRTRVGTPSLAASRVAKESDAITFVCEAKVVVGSAATPPGGTGQGQGVVVVKKGKTSEELLKQSSSLTQTYRNLRFTFGVAPIVLRYAAARRKAKRVRRRLKRVDEESYYDERTVLWDEEHEREAPKIRALFERMGGLYNKLAQDWATRDGMLPQPWVRALKGSFEALEPRPWSSMKRCVYDGLAKEGVEPARPDKPKGSVSRYFASFETEPLAAASIGQVHVATMYDDDDATNNNLREDGDETGAERRSSRRRKKVVVVVKAIYPEIRKNLVADLANARRAAHNITWALKLPMKGSVDAIMDEQCDSFPRELDLREEAKNIDKANELFAKHGINVQVPQVVPELSTSSILTQTFVQDAVTLANVGLLGGDDAAAGFPTAAEDMVTIAMAVGTTMFREKWYHSDPHPGNCMVRPRGGGPPALIDWGQCTELTDQQLRTICHLVMLLATKSPTLIDVALQHTNFDFNTTDLEHRVALLYYLFDSSREIEGVVSREATDYLVDSIRYTPKRMPVLTTVPREVVFYGRVVSTLRKSFDILKVNVSVVELWQDEARKALKKLNAAQPELTSTLLLLLPSNPAALIRAVEAAPDFVAAAVDKATKLIASLAFDESNRKTLLQRLFLGGSAKKKSAEDRPPASNTKTAAAALICLAAFLPLARFILVGLAALAVFAAVAYVAVTRLVGPLPLLRLFATKQPSSSSSSSSSGKEDLPSLPVGDGSSRGVVGPQGHSQNRTK